MFQKIDRFNILAIIPARSGSKSIIDKNIRNFCGKPLLGHSILHAKQSKLITRTIVSTDSEIYAEIAKKCGAEIPFLRPTEIAGDFSTDLEVFLHSLDWLKRNEGYEPDLCVHLRPTYPIRDSKDIDNMVKILIENPEIDSVRSISPADETPMKMWFLSKKNLLTSVVNLNLKDAHNLPRQKLPQAYMQNASIDVVRSDVIFDKNSMTGDRIMGYRMEHNFDIDTEWQWKRAEAYYERHHQFYNKNGQRTYCFDIDGVIASIQKDLRYENAAPIMKNIKKINSLYDINHKIILFTARGSETGIDWKELTTRQMKEWGVKYNKLLFGKPAADYYIDDKNIDIEDI
jgi:CMP-N,N'-diacetyllegionaminic acid synthase